MTQREVGSWVKSGESGHFMDAGYPVADSWGGRVRDSVFGEHYAGDCYLATDRNGPDSHTLGVFCQSLGMTLTSSIIEQLHFLSISLEQSLRVHLDREMRWQILQ
jgi:hypothetical protein